jgi:ABC-type Fe3+-siderophore transport system permease subunit
MGEAQQASADEAALAEITLTLAQDIFRIELETADTIDLKAVGLATADVAALTILLSFHGSVSHWWAASVLLAVAGVCLFLVMWQRHWELGYRALAAGLLTLLGTTLWHAYG